MGRIRLPLRRRDATEQSDERFLSTPSKLFAKTFQRRKSGGRTSQSLSSSFTIVSNEDRDTEDTELVLVSPGQDSSTRRQELSNSNQDLLGNARVERPAVSTFFVRTPDTKIQVVSSFEEPNSNIDVLNNNIDALNKSIQSDSTEIVPDDPSKAKSQASGLLENFAVAFNDMAGGNFGCNFDSSTATAAVPAGGSTSGTVSEAVMAFWRPSPTNTPIISTKASFDEGSSGFGEKVKQHAASFPVLPSEDNGYESPTEKEEEPKSRPHTPLAKFFTSVVSTIEPIIPLSAKSDPGVGYKRQSPSFNNAQSKPQGKGFEDVVQQETSMLFRKVLDLGSASMQAKEVSEETKHKLWKKAPPTAITTTAEAVHENANQDLQNTVAKIEAEKRFNQSFSLPSSPTADDFFDEEAAKDFLNESSSDPLRGFVVNPDRVETMSDFTSGWPGRPGHNQAMARHAFLSSNQEMDISFNTFASDEVDEILDKVPSIKPRDSFQNHKCRQALHQGSVAGSYASTASTRPTSNLASSRSVPLRPSCRRQFPEEQDLIQTVQPTPISVSTASDSSGRLPMRITPRKLDRSISSGGFDGTVADTLIPTRRDNSFSNARRRALTHRRSGSNPEQLKRTNSSSFTRLLASRGHNVSGDSFGSTSQKPILTPTYVTPEKHLQATKDSNPSGSTGAKSSSNNKRSPDSVQAFPFHVTRQDLHQSQTWKT